jgi:hypothetical protein
LITRFIDTFQWPNFAQYSRGNRSRSAIFRIKSSKSMACEGREANLTA